MRKIIVIVSMILTLAIAAAAQDSEFARPGPYLGIGMTAALYTELEDEIEETALALGYIVTADVERSFGFNVHAGYRTNRWVAAELEYEFLSAAHAEIDGVSPTGVKIDDLEFAEVRTWAFTGNLKVFPLHGRFQPFLLAGVGAVNQRVRDSVDLGLEERDTVAAGRFGVGFDVYETEFVALSIDATYLLPFSDLNGADGDYISVCLGLKFRP
jgi:opacity protein-like surface antigen